MAETVLSRFKVEFSAQVISMVAGGVLTVLLARLLSPDEYGLLYLSLSTLALFALCSKLGLPNAAAKYVTEYRATEPSQVPHIVRVSLIYTVIAALVTATGVLVFRIEIAVLVGEPSLGPLLLVGAFFVVATTLLGYTRTLLQGFEEIRNSSFLVILSSVCKLGFVLGFVLLGYGAVGALVGHVVAYTITLCLGGLFLYRAVRAYDVADRVESGLRKRVLEYNVPIFFTRGSNVLDKQVDTILVGVFLTPVAVSYYVVSKQFVGFLQAPAAALGFTVSPTLGKQKADDDMTAAARMYESTFVHILLLYVPASAGIALTARPAIEYTFGSAYLGAVPVLQVLSWFILLQAIMQVTSTALDFLGRARVRAIAKGATAVANVVLNILLIPEFGVVGAAIATVITYTIYAGANLYVITTEFPLRLGYLFRQTLLIATVTAAMSAIVFSLRTYVETPLTLAFLVALGVAIWFTLSLIVGLIDWNDVRATI
ncbi:flippase [Halobacteria archaeon AArc-curdl1]|uniref:Flippase n=1 Tax=Natronosalvus hydrolyticus TaxID=2979988 RepID=A0AAP3E5K6_9EURY|nr:flippase [Halobacteria archaeon AArc-curdl1]